MGDNITKRIAILLAVVLFSLASYLVYKQVREHHLQDDPVLLELKETLRPFFKSDRYWSEPLQKLNNIEDFMEEIKLFRGNKSYTINKEKVFICLKDPDQKYYNKNMLMFVLLHELAHVLCDEIGHTDKFHEIFDALILEASKDGIYNPSIPIIDDYCVNGDHSY